MTKLQMQVGAILFIFEGEELFCREAMANFNSLVDRLTAANAEQVQARMAAVALAHDKASGH